MPAFQDIKGQRFSRLLVLYFEGGSKWVCQCDCGRKKAISSWSLKKGVSTSCGCFRREMFIARNLKHGKALQNNATSEYKTWLGIKARVGRPHSRYYKNYGGRGISICERWEHSFENFLFDMGLKPSPQHSIDRIDNSKDYSPENCCWATAKQQSRNTRRNRQVTYKGVTKILIVWAEETGIPYSTLVMRLRRGTMTVEQAMETPVRKFKK